jgi:hypoxanthine-DNA glycosylase
MTLDDDRRLKASFPPVANAGARVLVLGSLPGEASLRQVQYYAHPQNQFWPLMGAVVDVDLASLDYAARVDALQAKGVALWDVVRQARRVGSLDVAIRDHQPNALADLASSLPRLRAIAFNGARAAQIGRRTLGDEARWTLIDLPSSSPANASIRFEAKLTAWRALSPYLSADGGR